MGRRRLAVQRPTAVLRADRGRDRAERDGRRQLRQTVELILGVAVGIGLADLLARLIGTGAIQIGVVVAVALVTATVIDGGPLLFGQAASSGILVVALAQPGSSLEPTRLFDALLGGGCALLLSIVILPVDADGQCAAPPGDPRRHRRSARRDRRGPSRARHRARAADARTSARARPAARGLPRDDGAGSEIASLAPLRRYARDAVGRYVRAEEHVAALTADTRVLARLIVQLLRIDAPLAREVPTAISDLGESVRALARELGEDERDARRDRSTRRPAPSASRSPTTPARRAISSRARCAASPSTSCAPAGSRSESPAARWTRDRIQRAARVPVMTGTARSGCPDLNWGPLRPERSALPSCATPRNEVPVSHRIGREPASAPAAERHHELHALAAGARQREADGAERADREHRADQRDEHGQRRGGASAK